MITTLIYDLDGTLVEFKLDIVGMKEVMISALTEQGVPRRYLRIDDPTSTLFKKSWNYLKGSGWPRDRFDILIQSILKDIEPFELEAAKATNLLEGVKEVLDHFRIEKYTQALLTNVPRPIAKLTLDRFNITNYFARIMGRDETLTLKPDPRGLGTLLRRLKVDSGEAVMIGDSVIDVLAAKANNVLSIGISSSANKRQELIESGSDIVLKEISELPSVIAQMQQSN
ncbi:MAG: HAD family hydrolase [Candidatus Ranarchaeia archaeon]